MLYDTIVMVYFKLKNRTCKSDPYKAEKSRIESYVKVGLLVKDTCRCTPCNNQLISGRGLASEIPITIAFA